VLPPTFFSLVPAPRFGHTDRMPLVPRSRRGTWLLAGVVWLGACAMWWWMLPVVPRAVLQLPQTTLRQRATCCF
jgi:hypothetical protein